MGLDSVELIQEAEMVFNIRIPDPEAEKIITVKDFYNCVWRHLEKRQSNRCKSQQLFYKLRRSLTDTFQVDREAIRPHTLPENLFPLKDRRIVYFNFAVANRLKLPDLVLPKPWLNFLTVFGVVTVLGGITWSVILLLIPGHSRWPLHILVASFLLTSLVSDMLNGKRTVIPLQSIREFTQEVLAINYAALSTSHYNRKEVESVINHIIINKMGVEPEEVKPESKLGDDLGVS